MKNDLINNQLQVDMKYGCTFDNFRLRYRGEPIPVFIWDNLQVGSDMANAVGCPEKQLKDFVVSHYHDAVTVKEYLPWYNLEDKADTYGFFCLEEPEDCIYGDFESYSLEDPRQIQGKIVSMSLQGINELDIYYNNHSDFTRVEIEVYLNKWSTNKMRCYTWMNDIDDVCNFHSTERVYKPKQGIDLVPFGTKKLNKEEVYSYGATS